MNIKRSYNIIFHVRVGIAFTEFLSLFPAVGRKVLPLHPVPHRILDGVAQRNLSFWTVASRWNQLYVE